MEGMVSIILPCYNQGIYLAEALESIIKQTYEYWEAIIVNDYIFRSIPVHFPAAY